MTYFKKIVVAAVLATTMCPFFISAMDNSFDGDDPQLDFQKAITAYEFEEAAQALKRGANPNEYYYHYQGSAIRGWVGLLAHYARQGTARQIKFLLDHGADPHVRSNETVLDASLSNKLSKEESLKIISLLVEKVGVDFPTNDKYKQTALHVAVQNHNIPATKLLLQLGANPNSKTGKVNNDYWESTPIDLVLRNVGLERSPFELVKLLYEHGSEPCRKFLPHCLPAEQIIELRQAREQMLAYQDCMYLGSEYPYPRESYLPPYKELYDSELLKYIPLPEPVAKLCADYSDNALPAVLLDPAVEIADEEPEAELQYSEEDEEDQFSVATDGDEDSE